MELVHLKFEPRFGPLIQDGRKQHSIRRYDTGERTPDIGDLAVCSIQSNRHQVQWIGNYFLDEVLPVQIDLQRMAINVAGYPLPNDQREYFAVSDGFTCLADMQQWFRNKYPDLQIYEGVILGWNFQKAAA